MIKFGGKVELKDFDLKEGYEDVLLEVARILQNIPSDVEKIARHAIDGDNVLPVLQASIDALKHTTGKDFSICLKSCIATLVVLSNNVDDKLAEDGLVGMPDEDLSIEYYLDLANDFDVTKHQLEDFVNLSPHALALLVKIRNALVKHILPREKADKMRMMAGLAYVTETHHIPDHLREEWLDILNKYNDAF